MLTEGPRGGTPGTLNGGLPPCKISKHSALQDSTDEDTGEQEVRPPQGAGSKATSGCTGNQGSGLRLRPGESPNISGADIPALSGQ